MTVPSGGEPAAPREEPAQSHQSPAPSKPKADGDSRDAVAPASDAEASEPSPTGARPAEPQSAATDAQSPQAPQPAAQPHKDGTATAAADAQPQADDGAEPGTADTSKQSAGSRDPAAREQVTEDGRVMPIPLPPVSRAPAGSAFGYSDAQSSEQFRLAVPSLDTIVAGPAVGSMISGIGGLMVAMASACLGAVAGMVITVATIVLAVFCAAAAGLLAGVSLRQIKRGVGEYNGRGMAITGLCCGGATILVVFFAFLVAFAAA